nr:hypothetical protein [Tanacetum cinerariifolium]
MADMTAPSGQAPAMAPPVRSNEEIVLRIRWVQIRKSNCYLDLDQKQSNPIFKTAVDLLMHTNFHRAFTASSTISSIYIQQRHKFHPRFDSPLHLPDDEPVLGYLKFSTKGIKREVFEMPIPGSLITVNIRQASFYQEYQENVAKHRRFLAGEIGSAQDLPAPKPNKPARKPKPTAHKAPLKPSVLTLVTTTQPAPTSAPAKPLEKKHKQATETSDKPAKAKRVKHGAVSKIHKHRSTQKPVAASEVEEVPIVEPQVANEDADNQKALEESMKTAYALPQGPLLPVVIREPESGKYQPFSEVPGKGKAKVTESKSKPMEKVVPGADKVGQSESEGQAGPDPSAQAEAGPDPGNAGSEMQSIPSHVVHAGSDREQMDLDTANVPPEPSQEQLDEGFAVTVYLKVQENLKLIVEEHVLLEDPASSSGTLSSLQHRSKDISFADLFFNDKPSEADNGKTTAKIEVESMVSVTIQQDLSTLPPLMWTIPPMTSPIVDLTSIPESPKAQQQFRATTTETTTTTTTTTLPPPTDQQQSTTEAMMIKRIDELEHIMANLIKVNKEIEERLDTHEARTRQDLAEIRKKKKKSRESPKMPPRSPPHQPPPPPLPAGSSEASGAPGAFGSSQVPPPPPPPSSTTLESLSKGSAAPSSSKTTTTAKYQAWTTTDIRLKPSISLTPTDLEMDEDMGLDEQAQLSDDEDIRSAHIPNVNLRQDWWKYLEEERPAMPEPACDIATFINWFCKRRGITELKPKDLEGLAFEIVKVFHPDVIHLQYQMEECHKILTDSVDDPILRHNVSKPLPLGGPPSQVSIQSDFLFNKDLEYLRYGSKGSRHALSISKMKATYYPDTGLEQMVPDQFWINEEFKYDISVIQDTYADPQCCLNRSLLSVWDESMFKYEFLDQEGRRSKQRVHVRYSESFEDKEDLPQPGELCWWTPQRRRPQTSKAYRMITSFWHSRPLSDYL